jgi:beta-N-acetylhexosaminidase
MATAVLRRTVGQLFMVGIPGPTLDSPSRAFLEEHTPGGVILFKRNVESARQVRALVASIKEIGAGTTPLVAIDHEGGRVHRLPAPFTRFPAMARLGECDPTTVERVGHAMGLELASIGIDLDFAPVLDVVTNPRNTVIGDRAFGATPARVARLGLALARGLTRAGIVPCGKHFPGHGASTGDSHHVLPRVSRSRRELEAIDLAPFRRAIRAGIPALLTAHVVYPALDPRRPATLSPVVCQGLLRRSLGFRGVVFSDDLDMAAVARRRSPGAVAVAALAAGCDVLLSCQNVDAARASMLAVEAAIARGKLRADAVAASISRLNALRRRDVPQRRAKLGWPAHARLAARLAAA